MSIFSIFEIRHYAETGRGAIKALAAIDQETPLMAEENFYTLSRLTGLGLNEAYTKLRKDAEAETAWAKEHPNCNMRCPASLHPEICPSFGNCPNW